MKKEKYLIRAAALVILMFFYGCCQAEVKKTFSKKDIRNLATAYLNNNVRIENPAFADVDSDGDFDILKFTKKGNVEFYKNTGTLEQPFFVLENKKFDNYEVSSFIPNGFPMPVFFADNDGDNDADVFGIVNDQSNKNKVVFLENTMDLDHYTLITIILVLVILLLLVLIL